MSKQVGRKPSSYITDAIIVIIMLALMFITVYPLLYTVFASFSDAKQLLKLEGPMWWPLEPFTLRGYELTFQNAKLVPSIFNTLFYVIVGTLGGLVITGMAAFVLSRKNFMLKNIIMKLIMFTMFFSGGIIPPVLRSASDRHLRHPLGVPAALDNERVQHDNHAHVLPGHTGESGRVRDAGRRDRPSDILQDIRTAVHRRYRGYRDVLRRGMVEQLVSVAGIPAQQLAVAPADDTARGADNQHQVRNDRRYLDGRGIVHPRAG